MRAWIKEERDTHVTVKTVSGSFAADVKAYLPRIASLVSYDQRSKQLGMWVATLGADRPRRTITTADVDSVLQGWLVAGLASGTVKKRRMALLSMWNTLDGKQAINPVRGSASPREPKPEARGMPYDVVQRILDAVARPCPGLRRLQVIAWTGLPPSLLMKIQRADLNLAAKTVRVRPRRKGAGVEARTLPLLPQAVEAFRWFDKANLYGTFNVPALNQLFVRACQRCDPPVEGMSLYDLRHSFLTMLYLVTKDLATVARFAMHATIAMSQRYAVGAMQEVDRVAAEQAGKYLSRTPVPTDKGAQQKQLHG